MNKQSLSLPGATGEWGSYISKYQPDSSKVLDSMFTAGSKNFITDQTGMVDKRQGGVQWNRTSFGNVAKDTYEAVFQSGVRHFLRVGAGILSASTGNGLFDTITSGFSTLGYFEFVTYQDRSYGCNGINPAIAYDIATSYGGVTYSFTTAKTKVMGAQAPVTAPTSGAPTSGGNVPVGSHRYVITYMYYDSEESNGGLASVVQAFTTGNQTGHLTSIPIGGYGVTARNIYRDNNDGVYLLLDTLNDNTTTTYTDTLLIGSTPTPIPEFNDVPPTFSKAALWLDSIFIAPTGETNLIRYSNTGSPDIFDPDNFITCQSDDVVTALYEYNGKLYVFGLHSFGSIEGNTPDTFYYHNLNNKIGCVDNRSIQVRSIISVPTLWWLSDKGLYFSNGITVEYGSDFIQDLVNLNLAQVNYSTNKNTQSSFADFSGDTFTPGIDINSNPGAVTTVNPEQQYETNADWVGGLSLSNVKTNDSDLLEVPINFVPSLASGTLSGDAQISGSNLTLPGISDFTGEASSGKFTLLAHTSGDNPPTAAAYAIVPPHSGVLTSLTQTIHLASSQSATYTFTVWNDSLNQPGSILFSQAIGFSGPTTQNVTVNPNVSMSAGTRYWVGISGPGSLSPGTPSPFTTLPTGGEVKSFNNGIWGSASDSQVNLGTATVAYNFSVTAIPDSGTWTSPIYDAGGTTAIVNSVVQSGSYPTHTAAITTVYASVNSDMSASVNQIVANPNGTNSLSLSGYRYWQVITSLATTDNRQVPTVGPPVLLFNTIGTWISNPIDSTTDNTGWGTLTYTGNTPLGTSVSLSIATSSDNITYSAFGPIGSALTQRWAKVMASLQTDSNNVTSPSIASITLDWNITATITSSIIDAGTIPAGFNTFQWEQVDLTVGTVTFYIRTAASSGGISSASFVQVDNGAFPNLTSLEFMQWKAVLTSTPNANPIITSVTVSWFIGTGNTGVRCSSIFYNKTYYLSVATIGATANNTVIQLDQFSKWRIQKDASIGTFLLYFNTLYFTDGGDDNIFNGFIANTDNGTAIEMDVRTKAWNGENDLFLKVPRAFKITGLNTGTTIHAYYSPDRGTTWIEMFNESGQTGFTTNTSGTEFTILFVPDATTLTSGRTLMYRIVSNDAFPCSIMNYVPSFYSRRGRYLSNG